MIFKRFTPVLIFISCFSAIALIAVVSPSKAAKPAPKEVKIPKCGKRKPPVKFEHEKHAKDRKIACKDCHHKSSEGKACHTCHKDKPTGKRKTSCTEASLKKNTFHVLCVGCHKKQKKGPRVCKACHVKK